MLSKLVEGFSWSEGCTGHQVWLALTRDDVCLLVGWIYNNNSSLLGLDQIGEQKISG